MIIKVFKEINQYESFQELQNAKHVRIWYSFLT